MGRTSLMLIIAFNVTFMMMGFRLSTATSKAYEKYCGYADIEQAGLAMESAANVAICYALLDTPRVGQFSRMSNDTLFKSGSSFTVTQYPKFDAVGVQYGESLLVIGKYFLSGTNPLAILDKDKYLMDTTYVIVTGNSFSQYVFFSTTEGTIYWGDGDTCRGRLHTQDKLLVNGAADFKGMVTTKGGVSISGGAKPNFEMGYTKADVTLPTDLKELNKLGTAAGVPLYKGVDTYVQFLSSGQVVVRAAAVGTEPSSVWALPITTTGTVSDGKGGPSVPKCTTYASVNALTSTGVLLVEDAALHAKGVLDGKMTLGCVDLTSGGTKSAVFIDSSLVYKYPPPSTRVPTNVSPDLLGIVATNDIMVSQYINHDMTTKVVGGKTVPNGTTLTNVNLNVSMFSSVGGFGAENYDTRGDCGKLTLVGGMQQKVRNAVGVQTTPQQGFKKDYDFDNNLKNGAPPGYPTTKFVIKDWVDHTSIPKIFWE